MNKVESCEGIKTLVVSPWLASLILRRGGIALSRFALYYQRLAALPRPWRRRLQRKLSAGLVGAALLMALAGPTAFSGASQESPPAVIIVVDGEVEIATNGKCSLIEAILNAQATRPKQLHADCAAGNLSGADTIELPPNGMFQLTQAFDDNYNGLPPITGAVTIDGNGATIERQVNQSDFPWFRILQVKRSGDLSLQDSTLRGGYVAFGGAAAGIDNAGVLALDQVTFDQNFAGYAVAAAVNNSGSLSISTTSFTGNIGNVIVSTGDATLTGTIFERNVGVPVINHGDMAIAASQIGPENYLSFINEGELTVTNSTVSGNRGNSYGAPIISNKGELTLTNSTISDNKVYWFYTIRNEGSLTLNRSIISGNTSYVLACYGGTESPPCDDPEDEYWRGRESNIWVLGGAVVADNFNILGVAGESGIHGFDPGPQDVVAAVPLQQIITDLADNGGPTLTHALPAGSPAIDLAPSESCAAGTESAGVDQRGNPRNLDGNGQPGDRECDAGAFEFQLPATYKAFIPLVVDSPTFPKP